MELSIVSFDILGVQTIINDNRCDNENFKCDSNSNWIYIKRGELLDEEYRIYLNLKREQKAEFIEKFTKTCDDSNIPCDFKFSKFDARLDEIVILSNEEEMEKYLEYIESITNDMDLKKVPALAGRYDGKNIGVTCEHIQNTYYRFYFILCCKYISFFLAFARILHKPTYGAHSSLLSCKYVFSIRCTIWLQSS